ncbi:MAG TPA: glycosyltransferase family 39 protein [Polyangia bacterium]|nr:glycosyltransferase family 39 protein [Polyangia bacterium]
MRRPIAPVIVAAALLDALKLWRSPSPAAGLPARPADEERAGAILAGAAIVWVFFVAVWGANGLFGDGHTASAANIGTMGYNMARYHTIFAYYPFLDSTPTPGMSYLHHPLGVFWMDGILEKIFGDHDWVLRFPAICYVTFTAFFLWRTGRAIWGPLEGALAAVAYTSLPITLGFANYHDMEQPMMFGCVVATWGYARFRQTGRGVYAAASVLGFTFAILHDWEAYVWGGAFLAWLFVRGFVLPERWFGRVDARRFGRYWAVMAATAVVVFAATVALILSANRLPEVLGMYDARTSGNQTPLALVLQARHVRIELMFTALGIALGKLAVPVILARFVKRRNELEALPLFLLFVAIVYYTLFKQGADVHIFWPHPFATYFGLAAGALAATARDGWAWLATRRALPPRLPSAARAAWVGAGLVALPLLLVWRDGASLIRLARETGCRFMEVWGQSDIDRNTALRWFLPQVPPPNDKVAFHSSLVVQWDTEWEIRPRSAHQHEPIAATQPRAYVMDTRGATVADLREAAKRFHVKAVGWHWLMDRGAPPAPLDGFSFAEHDPNLFESLSNGATEPVRHVTPDPWLTWEWRSLLEQPAEPPTKTPETLEELRIAFNAAVEKHDAAAAGRWRAEIVKHLDVAKTARWSNGLELLGAENHTGGARTLTPYFLVGPTATCQKIMITARVTRRRFLSTLPIDPAEPNIAYAPPIPCELWRPGHIYSVPTVYRHRAGHEEFTLSLGGWGASPTPAGPSAIKLLEL